MDLSFYGFLDYNPADGALDLKGPGGLIMPVVRPQIGNIFYLDPANGLDTNTGKTPTAAFKTLPVAYAALTDNHNDVLVYIATNSGSINLASAFTWAKNFTHFIGYAAKTPGSRAKIFQLSTATAVTTLFTVSGNGCMFRNIQIFQGVNDNASKVALSVTGSRNSFEDCRIAGIGNATQDVAGAASLKLTGSENMFKHCYIGLDTVVSGANGTEILFTGAPARNVFEDCTIYRMVSAVGHALVTAAAAVIDRFLIFKNCLFLADSINQAVTPTQLFSIGASVQGKIILQDCMAVTDGTPVWSAGATGIIHNNTPAAAASAGGGVATVL